MKKLRFAVKLYERPFLFSWKSRLCLSFSIILLFFLTNATYLTAQTESTGINEQSVDFGYTNWFGMAMSGAVNLPHQKSVVQSFVELSFFDDLNFLHTVRVQFFPFYPFDGTAFKGKGHSYLFQYSMFSPAFYRIGFIDQQSGQKILWFSLYPLGTTVSFYIPLKDSSPGFSAYSWDAGVMLQSDFLPLYMFLRLGWQDKWYGGFTFGFKFSKWSKLE